MRQALAAWNNSQLAEMIGFPTGIVRNPTRRTCGSFAWYYLWHVAHTQQLTLSGHASDVPLCHVRS